MSGQQIGLIFTGIFLVLTVFGFLKGFGRGTGRQLVRTITIVASAIISLIIANNISSGLAEQFDGKTMDEIIVMFNLQSVLDENAVNLLACFDAVTAERLIELPLLAILMPLIFSASFVIISGIALIVHAIVCAIFNFNGKGAKFFSRLLGALIGALQGAAVALIFLLPVINIVGIAADTNAHILENHPDDAEEMQFCAIYDEYFEDIHESLVFDIACSIGAEALCDHFATIKIDEEETNLRDTASLIFVAADDFMALGTFDWTAPADEQCDALENIVDRLSHDTYVATILSGTMRGIATSIDSGVIVFELEEPVRGVMNSLISIFTTLNEDNFARDMDTILDVYILLAKEGVLEALASHPEDITAAFIAENEAGETVIKRVIDTIQSNQHMKPLVTMLTKLSVSIMMQDVGIENGGEAYDTIKDGITNVIAIDKTQYESEEAYVAAVSESLDTTLKNHDIVLAPEIVDNMADYLASQDYSELGLEDITEDEINDVILSYYDAYLKYMNEGGENPFPELNVGGGDGE